MLKVSDTNQRNRAPLGLKIILIISNVFSGLLSMVLISVGLLSRTVNNYVSLLNMTVGLIISLVIFLSSIGTWKGKRIYSKIFIASWFTYYFYYLYNRFLDFIYLMIPKTELIGKLLFISVWVILVVYYLWKKYPMQSHDIEVTIKK